MTDDDDIRRPRTTTTPHRRRQPAFLAALAVGVATVLLASACAPAAPADTGSDESALSSFYEQELEWTTCEDFGSNQAQTELLAQAPGECARLEVPLDYDDPTGETASIAVSRIEARGEKIGSLLYNPGGPGGTGVLGGLSTGVLLGESPITERFDVVGFDPRGVGATQPAADCYAMDGETRGDELFSTLALRPALSEDDTRAVFERCADGSGGADALSHMGTRDTARDMDVLRAVLGDEQLTFLGQSYGTRLGAVYAEEFPDRVRAMILDGAFDPTLTTIDRFVSSYTGFQAAFDAMAADCARQVDCVLGTDPNAATEEFQSIIQPLREAPVPTEGGELDFDDAVSGMISGLYSAEAWPELLRGVAQVRDEQRGDILAGFGGNGVIDTETADGNFVEALVAINCMDEERLSSDDIVELRERTAEVAPFMDAGDGTPIGARDHCEFWPEDPTLGIPYAQDIPGLPATLVVSFTGDPSTPHSGAISLAETLGSSLLTLEGSEHTVVSGGANPCVDELASAYLIDLTLPETMPDCSM
jgi:pimeloyl-ACP methyl ester carboxylesterase